MGLQIHPPPFLSHHVHLLPSDFTHREHFHINIYKKTSKRGLNRTQNPLTPTSLANCLLHPMSPEFCRCAFPYARLIALLCEDSFCCHAELGWPWVTAITLSQWVRVGWACEKRGQGTTLRQPLDKDGLSYWHSVESSLAKAGVSRQCILTESHRAELKLFY